MASSKNPLRLNALQLKTLTLFQEIARIVELSTQLEDGGHMIKRIPFPHHDHLHIGSSIVSAKDASGLTNENVWNALARKDLIKKTNFPDTLVLTKAGQDYVTWLRDDMLMTRD